MEGLGLGYAAGFPLGISLGLLSGDGETRKKIKKQLNKAITDNALFILNKSGEVLTVEALFELLDKTYKKI